MKEERNNNKGLTILLIFGLLFVIGLFVFFSVRSWYNKAIFNELSPDPIELEVVEGSSFMDVINELEDRGYINNNLPIQVYLRTEMINPNIKVGMYEIPAGYNIPGLIEILEAGTFKPDIWVTIKEGLRYEEIALVFEENLLDLTGYTTSEFYSLVENPEVITFSPDVQEFLDEHLPSGSSLRGFLYPDTYRIDQDMTTAQIIEVMVKNFKNKVEENISSTTDSRGLGSINNLYEAVILASIIEKEASAWDDRSDISGVFHNRMEIGMALQSDATVNFITGKNDSGVELADQNIDSPYNTYVYPGLPPTPINNPRIESIIAALKPNDVNYFYFYHTPDGETFYNETFEDHAAGVCRDLGC